MKCYFVLSTYGTRYVVRMHCNGEYFMYFIFSVSHDIYVYMSTRNLDINANFTIGVYEAVLQFNHLRLATDCGP